MLNDFYSGTTKKFNVTILVQNAYPDISNDTVTLYLKDNKTDTTYALTASADVASSGSSGIAEFELTPTQSAGLNNESYFYEIVWNVSGSGEEYVLDQSSIGVLHRIEDQ